MSRAIGGARPWSENAGRVGLRHTPPPPIPWLIDGPRQSNFPLRASFFAAIITTAATPDSHPDCRALLIKIVALQGTITSSPSPADFPTPTAARSNLHSARQPSHPTSRAFLHWRLSDDGRGARRIVPVGRHPKPCTKAVVRTPATHFPCTSGTD